MFIPKFLIFCVSLIPTISLADNIVEVSDSTIELLTESNLIEPGDELKSWGSFREDTLPIIKIAELAPEAQKIIDRVGW